MSGTKNIHAQRLETLLTGAAYAGLATLSAFAAVAEAQAEVEAEVTHEHNLQSLPRTTRIAQQAATLNDEQVRAMGAFLYDSFGRYSGPARSESYVRGLRRISDYGFIMTSEVTDSRRNLVAVLAMGDDHPAVLKTELYLTVIA
jgi:hypothetical protein